MNTKQLNKIPLEQVLDRVCGCKPDKVTKRGKELAYKSPFREENTPSFFVDTDANIWTDLGESGNVGQKYAGGTVTDFMLIYYPNSSVKDVLDEAERIFGGIPPQTKISRSGGVKTESENPLKFVSSKPVFSQVLFQYLESRAINQDIGKKYCRQVQYKKDEWQNPRFALGFKNRKDGYEIRSRTADQHFKGLVGKRDITFIKGKQPGVNVQLIEGFMDFLSIMTIYNIQEPQSDVIILNGSALIGEGIQIVKDNGYQNAQTWFDNDTGGEKANAALKEAFQDTALKITPQNIKYAEFNDVNEMHCNLDPEQIQERFKL